MSPLHLRPHRRGVLDRRRMPEHDGPAGTSAAGGGVTGTGSRGWRSVKQLGTWVGWMGSPSESDRHGTSAGWIGSDRIAIGWPMAHGSWVTVGVDGSGGVVRTKKNYPGHESLARPSEQSRVHASPTRPAARVGRSPAPRIQTAASIWSNARALWPPSPAHTRGTGHTTARRKC